METTFLSQPLLNALVFFYHLTGSLGWAIISMTALLRLLLYPLTLPSIRSSQKLRELSPRLSQLKKKYGKDTQGLAKAQMELYRQEGINPAAGCLPQLIQMVVLIAFYRSFNQFLTADQNLIGELNARLLPALRLAVDQPLRTSFGYLNLTQPEVFRLGGVSLPGPLLIITVIVQFLSTKKMLPQVKKTEALAEKTINKEDDAMAGMQRQMAYLFPLMTLVIGLRFSSGLVLYWLVFSAVNLAQYVLMDRFEKKKT